MLKTVWPHAPAWVGVPIYVALGWVAVFVLPDLLHNGGVAALVLLLAGGALYTVGRACSTRTPWPNPWPHTFGYHEFFHAATVLAAICHHVAIWLAAVLGCRQSLVGGRRRALGPQVVHLRHGRPQLGQPLVGVLPDQPHRPGQRVRAGAGHAGVDQRVEHDPLGLPQPRHHRHRRDREQLDSCSPSRAPQATLRW